MLKGMLALNRRFRRISAAIILALIVSPILMSVDPPETTGHPAPIEAFEADGPLGQASNWTNDTRLTYEPDISATPDLALEGDNLHLVWADFRYGSHYVYAIPPFDTPRTVSYSINALDFVMNYNSTLLYSFEVTAQDTIPPEIELEPIAYRIIGREITIEAIVRDNSRVETVKLDYVDVLGNRFNVSMNLYEDNPKYYFTYRAKIPPQSQEGNVTYFIWAIDAEGIINMTEEYTVSVQSNDSNPPMIKHDPPKTRMFGYEVNIEAKVLDDAEVEIAGLDYVDVEGVTHNVTMLSRGNHTYSFGILPQPLTGTLNYSVWARDVNGNENCTPTRSIQIVSVDNELPAIVHPPIKSAVVGYWVPIHAFVNDNFGLWTANLSIDGGQIMLGLWSTDGTSNVYYKRSTDGGKTWDDGLGHVGVDRPLTRWGSNDGPRIAVEGDNLHVIFRGTDPPGIYYMVSRDNGRMWSAPRMLADLGNGDIAVHGDSVYVVWYNWSTPPGSERIHYTFSTDGGRTWSYGRMINETLLPGPYPPRIALDGQYLHMVIQEGDSIYLRYLRGKWNGHGFFWDDGMGNEGEARIVGSNDPRLWWPPQLYAITATGGNVHVVYRKEVYHVTRKLWCDGFVYDFYTPYLQLIHNVTTDSGENWLTPNPTILVDPSVPYDGHTCAPLYLQEQGHHIRNIDMAFDGSSVHVTWPDSRDDNSTMEIYYKTGDAEGKNWSNDIRLTFNETRKSASVSMALWNDIVHLSWIDTRDQWWDAPYWWFPRTGEIYYKRFPTFPSIHPPDGIYAKLESSTHEDVNITWSKSPDDQGNPNPVLQYELYYSTEYSRAGDGYQLLATINASESNTYSYVHMGVGNGNPNNYFYRIVAIDSDGLAAPCLTQAAKYTRWLTSGMQLVSIPLELREARIDEVFQTLNYSSIWHYDSKDRIWKSCHSSKPYCFFPPIDRSMAFWVNVRQDGYMTVAGIVPWTTWMKLEQGWNLIGYPSFLNDSSADVFAGLSISRSEAYEGSSLPFHLKLLSDIEEMKPGEGYWIYSQASQYLVLKN